MIVKEEVKEEVVEEPHVGEWNPRMVGQSWTWSSTTEEMDDWVGAEPWAPTRPRSPELSPPREEVVQAQPATRLPQAPPAHIWTPPPYIDLIMDND